MAERLVHSCSVNDLYFSCINIILYVIEKDRCITNMALRSENYQVQISDSLQNHLI